MAFLNAFSLCAIVFLSIPLPIFLSAAIHVRPSLCGPTVKLVWINAAVCSVSATMIIATPVLPLIAVAIAAASFMLCGMQMFQQMAKCSAT